MKVTADKTIVRDGDVPMPDRAKLIDAILAAEFAKRNAGTLSADEREETA